MASITYIFSVRDYSGSNGGVRKTGLTPTWVQFVSASSGSPISQPSITEVGQGVYKYSYDAEANGEAIGQVDAGVTLTNPGDRYLDMYMALDSSRIQTGISSTGVVLPIEQQPSVLSGTAQAGGATTITLASGASATDDIYTGSHIKISSGTGVTQTRVIIGYVGSTKVATVGRAWVTNPDSTSVYSVLAGSYPKVDSNLAVTANAVNGNVTGSVGSVTGAVGSVTGSVASVTGAVGSVTGNVGGNVVGSVASVSGSVASVTGAVGSVTAAVTVGTNNDKTGYALTVGEHVNIADDVLDAAQSSHNTSGTIGNKIGAAATGGDPWSTALPGGYASGTAGNIVGNNLDAQVSSRSTYAGGAVASVTGAVGSVTGAVGSVTGAVTVGGYSGGEDPATLLLASPTHKLVTNASGQVQLDMTEAIPTSNTAQTLGDALNAARAQGFGKWTLSGTTLTLYAGDGTTSVRTFTLDSSSTPTSRT